MSYHPNWHKGEIKMTAEGETNSKSTDSTSHLGGDTTRIEMIEEIAELSKIPDIKDHFSQVLSDVKQKFQVKIKEYYRLKNNIESESSKDKPEEMKEEAIPELSKAFEKSKTYFFELTRFEDPERESGFIWELGKFNLKTKSNGKIVSIIFDDFIKNVDQYEVTPHRIQDKIVDVPSLDKKFQISFTKSSPTRVVGFVKEAKIVEEKPGEKEKEEKAKKRLVVRSNRNMLKLATTGEPSMEMEKEELEELLQYNPEFTENILFSIRMKQAFDRL
jgi:hypothetical protein